MSVGAQKTRDVPDEELVRRFQSSGDADCFAELFVRHRKRIYLSCRGFFSDGSAAEDATQATFLRAYQKIGHFREGNFCGWLIRIARNVCIDQWRKRRPEIATDEIEPDALPDAETLDPTPLSTFKTGQITVMTAHVMKMKLEELVAGGLVEELSPPQSLDSSRRGTERWFRDTVSNVTYRLIEYFGFMDADDMRWEVVPPAEQGGRIQ